MRKPLEEYTFAAAYIGSYVNKLMDKQALMRLAQAKDLAAIESILWISVMVKQKNFMKEILSSL